MAGGEGREPSRDQARAVAAARGDDEATFGALIEPHRRELRVHCYRMLGSFDEAEDLVQETFLRAWRGRDGVRDRSTVRPWLYAIATNACLDLLARRPPGRRRAAAERAGSPPLPVAVPWLQPFPDRLLVEPAAPRDAEPDAVVVAKETIELAFLVAIQRLPPRQRAVLLLRDVLGWSAKETAALLGTSVAAVNSALQRARPALRRHLPERRLEWAPGADPSEEERAVLRRYVDAVEQADGAAIAAVLREDARVGHQAGAGGNETAEPGWYRGRATILAAWAPALRGPDALEMRLLPTRANRQPAVATYARPRGSDAPYRPFALVVLRIEGGAIAEASVFHPDRFPAFDLPPEI